MAKPTPRPTRRKPTQHRAQQTVVAILDAVIRLLKREGVDAVTTNRIAEIAGVSIGSVYQYFPDKRAIFVALHQRHIEQIDALVESTLVRHAASPLDQFIRAIVDALVDAHTSDPGLYHLLASQVPHQPGGSRDFASRLHNVFLLALSSRPREISRKRDLHKMAFVVTNLIESLSHAAALRRPKGISLPAAKAEATKAVLAYINA